MLFYIVGGGGGGGGGRLPVHKADNLTTFMCQLSWNLSALTSWNPQGLSRPVMGMLYFLVVTTWWMPKLLRWEQYWWQFSILK